MSGKKFVLPSTPGERAAAKAAAKRADLLKRYHELKSTRVRKLERDISRVRYHAYTANLLGYLRANITRESVAVQTRLAESDLPWHLLGGRWYSPEEFEFIRAAQDRERERRDRTGLMTREFEGAVGNLSSWETMAALQCLADISKVIKAKPSGAKSLIKPHDERFVIDGCRSYPASDLMDPTLDVQPLELPFKDIFKDLDNRCLEANVTDLEERIGKVAEKIWVFKSPLDGIGAPFGPTRTPPRSVTTTPRSTPSTPPRPHLPRMPRARPESPAMMPPMTPPYRPHRDRDPYHNGRYRQGPYNDPYNDPYYHTPYSDFAYPARSPYMNRRRDPYAHGGGGYNTPYFGRENYPVGERYDHAYGGRRAYRPDMGYL